MLIHDSCFHPPPQKKIIEYIQHMKVELKFSGWGWILQLNPNGELYPDPFFTGQVCGTWSSLPRAAATSAWVTMNYQVCCPLWTKLLSTPILSRVQPLRRPDHPFVIAVCEQMCAPPPPVHSPRGSRSRLAMAHELGLPLCELSKLFTSCYLSQNGRQERVAWS